MTLTVLVRNWRRLLNTWSKVQTCLQCSVILWIPSWHICATVEHLRPSASQVVNRNEESKHIHVLNQGIPPVASLFHNGSVLYSEMLRTDIGDGA